MCETVPLGPMGMGRNTPVDRGEVFGLDEEWFITGIAGDAALDRWECWHPETNEWEEMFPPPPGISYRMTPGSMVRRLAPEEGVKETPTEEVVRA